MSRRSGSVKDWSRVSSPLLFGLAPRGVYLAPDVATGAVRSYRTFSPLPRCYRGGMFSVALSVSQPLRLTPWPLASTLPFRVRTFLPDGPKGHRGDRPTCPPRSIIFPSAKRHNTRCISASPLWSAPACPALVRRGLPPLSLPRKSRSLSIRRGGLRASKLPFTVNPFRLNPHSVGRPPPRS